MRAEAAVHSGKGISDFRWSQTGALQGSPGSLAASSSYGDSEVKKCEFQNNQGGPRNLPRQGALGPSWCGPLLTEAGDNEDLETQGVGNLRIAGCDHFLDVKTETVSDSRFHVKVK